MAKYLVEASYTAEGAKGLRKDGGTKRREAARALIESMGGKLEAFYFAFGDADAVIIVDLPDNATAAASSIAVAVTGAITCKTTVLLSPEEIDMAVKKNVSYSAPGS